MATHRSGTKFSDQDRLCRWNHRYADGDRFGRMFGLPSLYLDPAILAALGAPGGAMDGGPGADRTRTVPVGHVFFGQFIDHDITLDLTSSLTAVNAPSDVANTRTPTLDLDCLYGAGPEGSNFLYEANDKVFKGVKLVTNREMRRGLKRGPEDNDVPRNGQGVALIGDFRNDENRVISQMQLGMIRAHNRFCDEIHASEGLEGGELFERAREATTWHYQWAVVHDFLVSMCGRATVDRILSEGRRFYLPTVPFIPVEFSVAAYRFGHSMVPQMIDIDGKGGPAKLFGGALGDGFDPVENKGQIASWDQLFFTTGGDEQQVQRAERCDSKLAPILLKLPFLSGEPPEDQSLATRNLRRGQSFLLPSGESVARHMGRDDAEIAQVSAAAAAASDFAINGSTPLWLYILTEGEVLGRGGVADDDGEGLGPVGATIVAEVLIGLLECDDRSWLSTNRDWSPMPDRATIGDLLLG